MGELRKNGFWHVDSWCSHTDVKQWPGVSLLARNLCHWARFCLWAWEETSRTTVELCKSKRNSGVQNGVWENPTRELWDPGRVKELLFSLSLFLPHLHQALVGLKISCFIFKPLTCPNLFLWLLLPIAGIFQLSLSEYFAVPHLLPLDVVSSFLWLQAQISIL